MRHRLAHLARGSQRCVLRFAARATEELDHAAIEGRNIVGLRLETRLRSTTDS